MENMYGIGVANRYSLFLNEELDPLEFLKTQEKEKELKKKKPKVIVEKDKVKTKVPKAVVVKRDEAKDCVPDTKTVPVRKIQNGDKDERSNKRNRDEPFPDGSWEERARKEFQGNNETDYARGGRGRGNRGRGYGRGRRDYDRQSGSDRTGVRSFDKRDGNGSYNWGSNENVEKVDVWAPEEENVKLDDNWESRVDYPIQTQNENPVEPPPETTDATEPIMPAQEPDTAAEETTAEDNGFMEQKQLTLDEWKALKASREKPQYNLRKAGEGEDPKQWKKMYELNKKKAGEMDSEDEEYDPIQFPQRVGRQKYVLDIDIRFNDLPRGSFRGRRGGGFRGGRGGRGFRSFRGGRGNGDGRGSAEDDDDSTRHEDGRQSVPKVDDKLDFPSLN